jgi:hypothetical protein
VNQMLLSLQYPPKDFIITAPRAPANDARTLRRPLPLRAMTKRIGNDASTGVTVTVWYPFMSVGWVRVSVFVCAFILHGLEGHAVDSN